MGSSIQKNGTKKTDSSSIPLELRQEQLSRHTLFFGEDGMKRLQESKICVVGAGGVGSHTVCSLIRAGVGYIRVIDFDQVSLSSLNRHACGTLADVGISKVACLVKYAKALCPNSNYLVVDGRAEMYTAETGCHLLDLSDLGTNQKWDLIVDAIDDVPTKAQLVYDSWKLGVRIISCMGAGGKADFTRLHISDLKSASRDPLATKLRQCLKKLLNSKEDDVNLFEDSDRLAIIFSSEKTVQKLADLTDEQKESVSEFGAIQGMRVRVLPVLGTMPAIMGQGMAAWALAELAQQPFSPTTGERVGRNVRNKLFNKLQTREEKFLTRILLENGITDPSAVEGYRTQGGIVNNVWVGPLQIDVDDVEYLLELWKNRCAITAARLGTVLELVRWDTSRPSTCNNLIVVAQHAKERWDKSVLQGSDPRSQLSPHVRDKICDRLSTCLVDSQG